MKTPTDEKFKDLTGQRFNRWTVIRYAGRTGSRRRESWLCVCDCAQYRTLEAYTLLSSRSKSCGCLSRELSAERMRERARERTSAGATQHPLYETWHSMRKRCNNPNCKPYHRYGGRGIKVCERWNHFYLFVEDMGEKPTPRHTLEREDNNGDYAPDNCCWATRKEQCRNTSKNRHLTLNGKTQCLNAWSEELGIPSTTIRSRIDRYGRTVEEALTQ